MTINPRPGDSSPLGDLPLLTDWSRSQVAVGCEDSQLNTTGCFPDVMRNVMTESRLGSVPGHRRDEAGCGPLQPYLSVAAKRPDRVGSNRRCYHLTRLGVTVSKMLSERPALAADTLGSLLQE